MKCFFAGSVAAFFLAPLPGRAEVPRLHLRPVVLQQIHSPTVITHAGDGSGRLFVCDQPGTIHIVRAGMLLPTPFLDLTPAGLNRAVGQAASYSERGLLGLAFHPDFEVPSAPGEGRFYVYFSAPSVSNPNPSSPQDHLSVISEFRVSTTDPDIADPTSERVLLSFGQPQPNHNGGQLEFGPDGFLYIGSGDGGGANDNQAGHTGTGGSGPLGNALDRTKLLGKILRIDPLGSNGPGGNYGIPASNPFVGEGGGVRGEIYAYGLRNPWRFSFDKGNGGTGRLFCGDVGQGRVEEVNLITAGGNYGWRYREGSLEFDPAMAGSGQAPAGWIDPIAEYAHPGVVIGNPTLPQLGLSITGGYVYRGSAIPDLVGRYVFADYRANNSSGGRLMALEETAPLSGVFTLTSQIPLTEANPLSGPRRILTLGEDEAGELYVGTKSNGNVLQLEGGFPAGGIYQIVPPTETSLTLAATRDNSLFENTSQSNGAGEHLYAGKTGNSGGNVARRALVRFDLSSVPDNTDIVSGSVILYQNLGGSAPTDVALHRLTADWGEAGSNAGTPGGTGAPAQSGDATWFHRIHNTQSWATAGGDFVGTPSATTTIDSLPSGDPVPRTWTGTGLVDDLEFWRAAPTSNFGWILIGDELGSANAQRFSSRESSASGGVYRPRLVVGYLAAPSPKPFETFLTTHQPGRRVGEFIDLASDEDGDGIGLLLEHAYGFSPLQPNPPGMAGLTVRTAPGPAGATRMTITFRRHPLVDDVTLTLRVGNDLTGWTAAATSIAGGAPTPIGGAMILSDSEISGETPSRLVTVEIVAPAGSQSRFARLEADLLP